VSRIEYLGHATTVLRLDGVRVLTDPLLRPRISGLVHRQPNAFDTLERTFDAILISHLHQDHLDQGSLKSLGRDACLVVPRHGARVVRSLGFREVREVQPGDELDVGSVHIRVTRAVHMGLRAPFGPWGGTVGFVLEDAAGRRVYFAGDTQSFREMATLGSIDVALVPIAGWGPVLGPGHMGPRAAIEALQLVRPEVAIPIHWGTLVPYGLHRRVWSYLTRPPLEFQDLARQHTPGVRIQVLQPGGSFTF